MNLAERFDATARLVTQRPAVADEGGALSYEDLRRWSEAVALSLGEHRSPDGCRGLDGRRVALVLPNGAGFVAAFLGAARAGAVVAPLNPGYRLQELLHYLADMEPAAVLVAPDTAPPVREALTHLAAPPRLVMVGNPGTCQALAPGGDTGAPEPAVGSPPLLLLYTSGSTGRPKRVIRTHAQLIAELDTLRTVFEVTPADRVLGAAPFSHVNGLVRSMLNAMLAGATLYPIRHFARRPVLELIARERPTFFGGVPPMFVLLAQTAAREPVDLSSLRVVFSSSAPLTTTDSQRFQQAYGIVVRQLYGSTETGTICYNDEPRPEEHPDSVGRALPGVSLAVHGERGESLPHGVEGEIAVASPFAVTSYAGNDAATRKAFRDGWYRTGDLGRIDPGGLVTLTGRARLMINRGGYKVNPYEVEAAIRRHPKVVDVAVVGVPGPHGDQAIRCLVVAREACSAEEIVLHCRNWIADYKIPSRIEFCDALPRTPTGKIPWGRVLKSGT